MLVLVHIDLSNAEIGLFESYESRALSVLTKHGGRLEERVRTLSSSTEIQLLYFPDEQALTAFRNDPVRTGLRPIWIECGASSVVTEVTRV